MNLLPKHIPILERKNRYFSAMKGISISKEIMLTKNINESELPSLINLKLPQVIDGEYMFNLLSPSKKSGHNLYYIIPRYGGGELLVNIDANWTLKEVSLLRKGYKNFTGKQS